MKCEQTIKDMESKSLIYANQQPSRGNTEGSETIPSGSRPGAVEASTFPITGEYDIVQSSTKVGSSRKAYRKLCAVQGRLCTVKQDELSGKLKTEHSVHANQQPSRVESRKVQRLSCISVRLSQRFR